MTYVVGAEIVNLVNIYCACSLDEITGSFLNTLFLVEENFVFHLFLFCPIFEDSKFHVLGLNFVWDDKEQGPIWPSVNVF